jgi:hypothetical protein
MLYKTLSLFWSSEALQEFLNDDPGAKQDVVPFQASGENLSFGYVRLYVATKGQRPDAGIDDNVHFRDRSFL